MSLILESVKKALIEGESTVNLKEASTLTGSGSNVGGRVIYDDAFAPKREHNPLRDGARIIDTIGSDQAFVVKTGNATLIENAPTTLGVIQLTTTLAHQTLLHHFGNCLCARLTLECQSVQPCCPM